MQELKGIVHRIWIQGRGTQAWCLLQGIACMLQAQGGEVLHHASL